MPPRHTNARIELKSALAEIPVMTPASSMAHHQAMVLAYSGRAARGA
jgi:hypothetical protein